MWRRATAAWLIGTLTGVPAATPPGPSGEYEVKAAALRNIIAFIEWPESAFVSADSPLVITVFGRGPIGRAVAEVIQKETWRGRRLQLQRNPPVSEARSSHVIFVSRTEQERWPFLRGHFAGRPILVVGDAEDFAREAGMVQLTIERNKLHLTVNLAAVRAGRLQISSTVLRLAEVIGADNE